MKGNSMNLPIDALAPEFLERIRLSYLHDDPASKALQRAGYDVDETSRRLDLDRALKIADARASEILLAMIAETPEPDDQDATPLADRARASFLFLHGHVAGYWPAAPKELDQARALIVAQYGTEAVPMMPEKTKADLAREAGLPTHDLVSKKKRPRQLVVRASVIAAPQSKLEALASKDAGDIRIGMALAKAGAEMNYIARDPKSTPVMKLEAVQEYLRVLDFLQPGSWAKFCADNPDFVAAAREAARRTLQKVKS
jgi:hypothetical protein